MKKQSVHLRTAVLFGCISAWAGESAVKTAAPAPAAEQPEQAKPLNPGSLVGSVKIGDATIVTTPGGKSEVLIESGNTVIFQKNGASTFTEVPRKGKTPQFVHDSGGKVVGPLSVGSAPKIRPRPNPVPSAASPSSGTGAERESVNRSGSTRSTPSARQNRPSPIERSERPSRSTMPSSPFLRPNPIRR